MCLVVREIGEHELRVMWGCVSPYKADSLSLNRFAHWMHSLWASFPRRASWLLSEHIGQFHRQLRAQRSGRPVAPRSQSRISWRARARSPTHTHTRTHTHAHTKWHVKFLYATLLILGTYHSEFLKIIFETEYTYQIKVIGIHFFLFVKTGFEERFYLFLILIYFNDVNNFFSLFVNDFLALVLCKINDFCMIYMLHFYRFLSKII